MIALNYLVHRRILLCIYNQYCLASDAKTFVTHYRQIYFSHYSPFSRIILLYYIMQIFIHIWIWHTKNKWQNFNSQTYSKHTFDTEHDCNHGKNFKMKGNTELRAANCYQREYKTCCPSTSNSVTFVFPRRSLDGKLRVGTKKVVSCEKVQTWGVIEIREIHRWGYAIRDGFHFSYNNRTEFVFYLIPFHCITVNVRNRNA